jgi:Helix-turn-helix domain
VDAEEARTIGWTVACPRRSGQVVRVIAGLAGMSKDTLNRIERGERSPTLSEVRALALKNPCSWKCVVIHTWQGKAGRRHKWHQLKRGQARQRPVWVGG